MNYVIIGNSAAAVGTIEGIRQIDKTGKITVISDEKYHTYSRPLISYWLMGKVTDKNIYYRSADFYEKNGVETRFDTRVTKIDPSAKNVVLADGSTVPYDKLMEIANDINQNKFVCKCSVSRNENRNVFTLAMEFVTNSRANTEYQMSHALRLLPAWVKEFNDRVDE